MEVIDEEGNLFGVVNVVDALVVLVVLSVVVAGVALAGPLSSAPADEGESPPEEAVRYVTLDLGQLPAFVAEDISEDEVLASSEPGGDLTVTDVYVGPTGSGNVSVAVRAEVEGVLAGGEDAFEFDGQPVDENERLTLDGTTHELHGTVVSVEAEGKTLDVEETEVAVRSTVSADTANRFEPGDTYTLADHEVATLETVEVYSTADATEKRVVAGLSLKTMGEETPVFGAIPVTTETTVDFEADAYRFSGTIIESDTLDPPGDRTTTTAVVKLENVAPETADAVRIGMEDRVGETTTVRVLEKQTEPATVVREDEEGVLREHEHPRNQDVFLTVELLTYDTPACIQFGTECLRIGEGLTMDFRTVVIEGTVIEIEDDDT